MLLPLTASLLDPPPSLVIPATSHAFLSAIISLELVFAFHYHPMFLLLFMPKHYEEGWFPIPWPENPLSASPSVSLPHFACTTVFEGMNTCSVRSMEALVLILGDLSASFMMADHLSLIKCSLGLNKDTTWGPPASKCTVPGRLASCPSPTLVSSSSHPAPCFLCILWVSPVDLCMTYR